MSFSFDGAQWRVIASVLVLAGALSACNRSPNATPQDLPQLTTAADDRSAGRPVSGSVEKAMLLPGGDYSLVTVRSRPDLQTEKNPRIMCVAPSPDWASAITTAQTFSGSVGVPSGTKVSADASNSLAETITAMVGRTAGVVALRDGLYNACQAYANGVIGKDAYALILSQYGNLLVALAGPTANSGGSDKSAASPSSSPSTAPVAVSVSAGSVAASPAAAPAKGGSTDPTASAGNAALGQMQLQLIQALVVACISNQDKSVRNDKDRNTLLGKAVCSDLVSSVVAAVPKLLGPPSAPAGGNTGAPKPASNPKVVAVQDFLITKDCDGSKELVVDGILGDKTRAAYAACEKKYGPLPIKLPTS